MRVWRLHLSVSHDTNAKRRLRRRKQGLVGVQPLAELTDSLCCRQRVAILHRPDRASTIANNLTNITRVSTCGVLPPWPAAVDEIVAGNGASRARQRTFGALRWIGGVYGNALLRRDALVTPGPVISSALN